MNLQRYYVPAVVSMLMSPCTCTFAASFAEGMALERNEMHALALAELHIIRGYINAPASLTAEALARQLHFEHSVEQCEEAPNHQNYCLYALTNQQSRVARILTLGIGRSKASGLPGARIDWAPWSDQVCITTKDLQPLLGDGHVIDVNVPYLAPGSTATPPVYRNILYAAIPGAGPSAQAKAAFREKCVTEIDLTF